MIITRNEDNNIMLTILYYCRGKNKNSEQV